MFVLLGFRLTVVREIDGQHVFKLLFVLFASISGSVVKLTGLCGALGTNGRSSYDFLALIVGCPGGVLGASVGGLVPLWGTELAILGRSRILWVRSRAALGAYVDGLGLLSGPLWAVLG